MKKIFSIISIILVVVFLSLYFSKNNTEYYMNQKVLTEEAIERFENDLKEGKEINPNDYIPKEKDYNNKVSKLGLKTSNFVDKVFNKSLKLFAKYISKLENS